LTDDEKTKLRKELDVINYAQEVLWKIHHSVKNDNEELGMKIWQMSLQIESALLHINEELLGGSGYYENT